MMAMLGDAGRHCLVLAAFPFRPGRRLTVQTPLTQRTSALENLQILCRRSEVFKARSNGVEVLVAPLEVPLFVAPLQRTCDGCYGGPQLR